MGSKTPQLLVDLLGVARPLAPGFKRQAYGRDVLHPQFPMEPDDALDGVFKFSAPLMESLGEPLNWGALVRAIWRA
eukprot:6322121-Alexandrium_andersonii.AAC.1